MLLQQYSAVHFFSDGQVIILKGKIENSDAGIFNFLFVLCIRCLIEFLVKDNIK